ncbi:MAG: class I SAM-dependent methyltransferase, partial [Ignavibacteriaceae bacterium]|nr:class I SAM-dependent methyltransferase [Ignavibacteriaceae bacterium]
MVEQNLKQVEEFWDENLCGHHFVDKKYLSREFFDDYTKFRYTKTHHLDVYIDWSSARGKDVLEIGIGIGADGTRWAEFAKTYTGVDLTREAVNATKLHFGFKGLKGDILQGNAEKLELPSDKFDIVYSHG